jgi:hypothetical protein
VLDEIAVAQGDDCDAVGDVKGDHAQDRRRRRRIEGCTGPARGRIVFEAKASRLSKPKAVEELDRARTERKADYAVLVVPDEERIPARMHELREYGGDKLVVCFDPRTAPRSRSRSPTSSPEARVLMARGEADGVDAAAIREAIERAGGAMGDVLRVKQQLTGRQDLDQQERRDPRRDGRRRPRPAAQVELLLAASEPEDEDLRLPAPSAPAEAECSAEDEGVEVERRSRLRGAPADPRPGPARVLGL